MVSVDRAMKKLEGFKDSFKGESDILRDAENISHLLERLEGANPEAPLFVKMEIDLVLSLKKKDP